jgi:hypothetical protein
MNLTDKDRARFLSKVRVNAQTHCWEWQGCFDKDGYGFFRHQGKNRRAHRVAFKLHNGTLPTDAYVLHACDNPKCVNPEHLLLGTNADNIADMIAKGRSLRGSTNHNSKLTEEQVAGIRTLTERFYISQRSIAKSLNVSQVLVSCICRGKTWKHVAPSSRPSIFKFLEQSK